LHRLRFPEFAHDNDVRIFPQDVDKSLGEGRHVSSKLSLLDEGLVRCKPVLNRIFESDNMRLAGVVDVVDYGSDSCCFTGSGGAARQNQTRLDFGDFMQRGMEVELVDRRDMPRKDSDGQADPSRRRKEVDSKTGGAHGYGEIKGFLLPKHIDLCEI